MKHHTICVFGEAEKGELKTPIFCTSLLDLFVHLGHPPKESLGIEFAIQFLEKDRDLIFFRVSEEGFLIEDYLAGFAVLEKKALPLKIGALCLPGVGDPTILEAAAPTCLAHRSLLLISEKDLYDYLTNC